MKAEHRKELETNILADRVGKIITTAKQGPSRGSVYNVLIGLGLVVVLFFGYRWYVRRGESAAQAWLFLEDGGLPYEKDIPEGNAKKAVRFQKAWVQYWKLGVQRLGAGNAYVAAMNAINEAEESYRKLEMDCKGDPVFHPEALYGLAIIAETRAIESRDNLDTALDRFKELAKAYPDSAFGKLATKRISQLEDADELANIKRFYHTMETRFKPRPQDQLFPGMPPGHPEIPAPMFPKKDAIPDAPKVENKDEKKAEGGVPADIKKVAEPKLPEPPKGPEEKKGDVPPAKAPDLKKAEDVPPAKNASPAPTEAKTAPPVAPPAVVDPKK